MANIKAGTAYIDVRLGSIEDFNKKLAAEVEKAGTESGKKLGENIKKSIPPTTGAEIGKGLNKELTKAFFKDAKTDMTAGFRALANQDLRTAGELFKSAGRNFGTSLRGGFDTAIQGMADRLNPIADRVSNFASRIGNSADVGWRKFQEMGKAIDGASQKLGFLSFQIQNFGLIATLALAGPTAAVLGFGAAIGISTAADIESATKALEYLLPPAEDVEQVFKRLNKIAVDSPVFDTADLIQYAQKFTAAGVEIEKTERFLRAFSNIALVTGVDSQAAARGVQAISQAFGKGKLQAEELNQQLGEAMPAVLKLLREELGVTQSELTKMVSEGKISGDDLIAIFTRIGESEKFLNGAAAGARTLNGVWQQLKESVQTQLGVFFLENSEKIKEALDKAGPTIQKLIEIAGPAFLKLINGFASLVDWIGRLVDWYKSLSPTQQNIINKLILFATVLGPIVVLLGTLVAAFAGVSAVVAAVATPVGGIILAIVALGVAIGVAVAWLRKFLAGNSETATAIRTAWNSFYETVIAPVKQSFMDLWTSVKEAFNQIKGAITGNTDAWKTWGAILKVAFEIAKANIIFAIGVIIGVIKTIIDVLGPVIKAIASFISGIIKIFKGLTEFLAGVFTGDWSRAWEGIKQIWDGIWDAIIGTLANIGEAIWKLIKGIYDTVVNAFKAMYNILVGNSIVPDMVNAIIGWFKTLLNTGKALLNALGAFISGLYNRYVKPFVDKIAGMVNTVRGKFSELVSKVKGVFEGFSLYNIGVNLINGLINGIQNMAGRLFNVASGIARTVIEKVSGIFEIGSPSKVFQKIGEWNMEGLANGMKEGLPGVLTSAGNVGDMISKVSPEFGSPREPLIEPGSQNAALAIENYYANDNVDPWRQAEDWYFMISARGGVS